MRYASGVAAVHLRMYVVCVRSVTDASGCFLFAPIVNMMKLLWRLRSSEPSESVCYVGRRHSGRHQINVGRD